MGEGSATSLPVRVMRTKIEFICGFDMDVMYEMKGQRWWRRRGGWEGGREAKGSEVYSGIFLFYLCG